MYLSSVNEIKTTWPGHILYHLLVKLFVTCDDESHLLSSPWCFNFELFAPFFLGDWGAYLYHVTLIKVVCIVSTQKANHAARFSAARFIAAYRGGNTTVNKALN